MFERCLRLKASESEKGGESGGRGCAADVVEVAESQACKGE